MLLFIVAACAASLTGPGEKGRCEPSEIECVKGCCGEGDVCGGEDPGCRAQGVCCFVGADGFYARRPYTQWSKRRIP